MKMIPEGQILLFDDGIYTMEKFDGNYKDDIEDFKQNTEAIDLYCPHCNKEKTFSHENSDYIYNLDNGYQNDNYDNIFGQRQESEDDIFYKSYKCPTCNLKVIYIFKILKDKVVKIAQYPSLRDVSVDNLSNYNKSEFVQKDDIENMRKAKTLACESFYIGAYSYMRRVFESLIDRTYKSNIEKYSVDESDFSKKHMSEKVAMIKTELPVDDDIYNIIYSSLSDGIHQLSEKECEDRYQTLYSVMVDILADEKSRKEKQERRKDLKKMSSNTNQ